MSEASAIPATYQIVVTGWLDEDWSPWFAGLTVNHTKDVNGIPITILNGSVADQAALYGVLARLADLNVPLRSVSSRGVAALAPEVEEVSTQ